MIFEPHDIVVDLDMLPDIADMVSTGGMLPDYHMVDQLHEPTSDGLLDENARMNCVFASYASEVKFLCRPEHQDANGDYIKDQSPAYGQGYIGGSAAERVAPTVKALYGVDTEVHYVAERSAILQTVIAHINLNQPSMTTIPSAWNTQKDKAGFNPDHPNFPTHAVVVIGYNPITKEIICMNPWGGFLHRGSYAYWVAVWCYLKCYPSWKIGAGIVPLPTGWKDDGNQLTNPITDKVYVKGMRRFVLDSPTWDADDVPEENERLVPAEVDLEGSNPDYGKGAVTKVQQVSTKSMLAAIEDTPGNWRVGKEYVGRELLWARKRIAELEAAQHPAPTAAEALAVITQDLKDAGKL
jgi:hypothetical protein